jgi:hypothetical protein
LFPVAKTIKTNIPRKYPVIVGIFPANISENGVIKVLKKTQKMSKGDFSCLARWRRLSFPQDQFSFLIQG